MAPRSETFDSELLLEKLETYPAGNRYVVGFSGGADSTALLLAMHELRGKLAQDIWAIHFNHGLQAEAKGWQAHCEAFCGERKIPFVTVALALQADADNLEARARELRYREIESILNPGDIYLTAHHADDQAETFLLHALRGSGIEGLAGIPEIRSLGAGWVARPLLNVSRAAIETFLGKRNIPWLEDRSNSDRVFDRNYLRHEVLPVLESRWPAARRNLARSARLAQTSKEALHELLGAEVGAENLDVTVLPLQTMLAKGQAHAALVLRSWLRHRNVPPLPKQRLDTFVDQLWRANSESDCETNWSGFSLRYFDGNVHLIPPDTAGPCPTVTWSSGATLRLAPGTGLVRLAGPGANPPRGCSVGARRPGSRIRIEDSGPRRTLKNLFREAAIPPWQRLAVPVLYWERKPAAIGDWTFSAAFRKWLEEHALDYEWQPEDRQLRQLRMSCRKNLLDR